MDVATIKLIDGKSILMIILVITGVKSKNTDFYFDYATKIEFWLQMGREKKVSQSQTLMDYISLGLTIYDLDFVSKCVFGGPETKTHHIFFHK